MQPNKPHAGTYHMRLLLCCRVGRLKDQMAEICVKAVLSVADLDRRDVNLDLIKVRAAKTQNDLMHGASWRRMEMHGSAWMRLCVIGASGHCVTTPSFEGSLWPWVCQKRRS